MARVQSVSAKADALLVHAGRNNSQLRGAVQGTYPSERLIDLTERLARLETLLDEVSALGSFPGHPASARQSALEAAALVSMPQGHPATARQSALEVAAHPGSSYHHARQSARESARQSARAESEASYASQFAQTMAGSNAYLDTHRAGRALSFRSNVGTDAGGMASVAPPTPNVPLMGIAPQVHGPTPRSSGRFIEVCAPPLGVPGTPTVPMPPGIYSPAMPPPSFLNRSFPASPHWNAASPPPVGHLWNSAEATPRAGGGTGTPRVGSRAVRTSVGGYGRGYDSLGGRAEVEPQRQAMLGPNGEPLRSFSAPRPQSVPPLSVLTAAPLQQMGPPIIGAGVSTPGMPPPPGLWLPSLGKLLQDSVDSKIRRWLSTIPIGNGANRGWDDSQITEIAGFAQDKHLEHLAAEDIYKKYVEHQVESATAGS